MTNKKLQKRLAKEFLKLHYDKKVLLLPNAWDVLSAKMYEKLGFKAIGTTSAGIAATLGHPDGQIMSLEENIGVVKRIVDSTSLPVSVDIESGYSATVEGAVKAAEVALDIGAVGINLEDSTGNDDNPFFKISEMVERIKEIRSMADSRAIPLVVNLRTDVYMSGKGEHSEKFKQTVERGNIYRESGADCIFVTDIGTLNEQIISEFVKEINAPLNIIAGISIPPIQKLQEIGVARLSFGPRPMRAAYAFLKRIMTEILIEGTYSNMIKDTLSYSEVNSLLKKCMSIKKL